MSGWVWLGIAWAAVAFAWVIINGVVGALADRRMARMTRETDRKKLRYETWRRVSRLGVWG
jgi:hypothetical protein